MLKENAIKSLLKRGLLSEIDIHFANFITGFSPDNDPDIFLAAALVSQATGSGDICLNHLLELYHFDGGRFYISIFKNLIPARVGHNNSRKIEAVVDSPLNLFLCVSFLDDIRVSYDCLTIKLLRHHFW